MTRSRDYKQSQRTTKCTLYEHTTPSLSPSPRRVLLHGAPPPPPRTVVRWVTVIFSQLDRLLPPLMSCLLHIDFERRNVAGGGGGGGRGGFGNGGSSQEVTVHSALPPPKWTHWKVRDYAAELLRAICDK